MDKALTNCLRERRRLVMNLRVRRVTAAAALESDMAGVGRAAPGRGEERRRRRSAAEVWLAARKP
jgi:hypothetical protein